MLKELNISEEIFAQLSKQGRGRIFFAQEFYGQWPESSVRFALSSLALEGKIARLARGVFVFPKLSEHGMKMILPDEETVAHAVADKSKVRIVPVGDQAARLAGLTSLSLGSTTYLTDGAPRRIRLSNGRTIEFRHTSEMRIFAFSNRRMQLASNAIRALGVENIGDNERENMKWFLSDVPADEFENDIMLCPEWVREILLDLKIN